MCMAKRVTGHIPLHFKLSDLYGSLWTWDILWFYNYLYHLRYWVLFRRKCFVSVKYIWVWYRTCRESSACVMQGMRWQRYERYKPTSQVLLSLLWSPSGCDLQLQGSGSWKYIFYDGDIWLSNLCYIKSSQPDRL